MKENEQGHELSRFAIKLILLSLACLATGLLISLVLSRVGREPYWGLATSSIPLTYAVLGWFKGKWRW